MIPLCEPFTAANSCAPIPHSALPKLFDVDDICLLMSALRFSAERHKDQRRKDQQASPYINHPIQVAEILWRVGAVSDMVVLIAALLHDTLEDTETTAAELEKLFGTEITRVVQEVSDDPNLSSAERKRLQVEHAPHISLRAQQVKLADKICNIYDITHQAPPRNWTVERKQAYLDWSEQVVAGLRGCNVHMERYYDELLARGRHILQPGEALTQPSI